MGPRLGLRSSGRGPQRHSELAGKHLRAARSPSEASCLILSPRLWFGLELGLFLSVLLIPSSFHTQASAGRFLATAPDVQPRLTGSRPPRHRTCAVSRRATAPPVECRDSPLRSSDGTPWGAPQRHPPEGVISQPRVRSCPWGCCFTLRT